MKQNKINNYEYTNARDSALEAFGCSIAALAGCFMAGISCYLTSGYDHVPGLFAAALSVYNKISAVELLACAGGAVVGAVKAVEHTKEMFDACHKKAAETSDDLQK